MKSKLAKENVKRVKDLEKDINSLHRVINEKMREVEDIFIEGAGDFKGSYIEYYDGDQYIFMKVERQYNRMKDEHCVLNLQGPSIKLFDNPLREEIDEGGNVVGEFDDMDGFSVGSKVFEETALETLRKITKADMKKVVKTWVAYMNKSLGLE